MHKFTVTTFPLWRKYTPEVRAAKGLKWCWAKVKGVNNPAWTAKYPTGQVDDFSISSDSFDFQYS